MSKRICAQCGVEYDKPPSINKKFCSQACYMAYRVGPNHPNWKGTARSVTKEGYARVLVYPDSPHYGMGRRHSPVSRDVLEHRLVMAQHLGRDLLTHETVHHRNGDKTDNRLENLELWVGRHGRGTNSAHCATCSCFD